MAVRIKEGWRRVLATAVTGVLGSAAVASAQDSFWNQPAGGAFDVPEHWLPVGVPGSFDTAHFNLDQQGYTVQFNQDQTNLRLRVHQGHSVLNLGGHTYAVTDVSPGQFSVIVGMNAEKTGELSLTNGVLQASRSIIGQFADSIGIVHVGADTSWNTAQLYVGRDGDGTLNITGGGQVTSTNVSIIADFAGSRGHVLVSGAGSLWQLQFLELAFVGYGTIDVLDGGLIRSADVGMALIPGSTAEVTVAGAGSEWEMAGALEWNEATITISDGGVISAGSASGGGSITIETGASLDVTGQLQLNSTGTIHFRGGTLEAGQASIAGQLLLDEGGDKVVDVGTLMVDHSVGGKVDLADNELLVRQGDPAAIQELVKVGWNGGSWDGDGITSSSAGETGRALGIGPDGEGVRVRFTWAGDASLDGSVTIADLGILAANWQGMERGWWQGDFNYDGQVTIADLGILAANWQKGVGAAAPGGAVGLSFEEAMGLFDAFSGVVVPEPGLGMVGLLFLGMAGRRQRRRTAMIMPAR